MRSVTRRDAIMVAAGVVGLAVVAGSTQALEPLKTGVLHIRNKEGREIEVRVYHSAAPNRVFARYTLKEGQEADLEYDGKPLVVGPDWIVQIDIGNGRVPLKKVGDAAFEINGKFVVISKNVR